MNRFRSKTEALRAVKMICDEAHQTAGARFPPSFSIYYDGKWSLEDQRVLGGAG